MWANLFPTISLNIEHNNIQSPAPIPIPFPNIVLTSSHIPDIVSQMGLTSSN